MSHSTPGSKSKTDDSAKDLWNTTLDALEDAEALIGQPFTLDVCSTGSTEAKAERWITPEQDALAQEWATERGAAWCNPPFTKKREFLERAYDQAKHHGITVCCMVPFTPATKWWREFVSRRATAVYIPDGRYDFIHAISRKRVSGVNFASAFVVFTPLTVHETIFVDFKRGIGRSQNIRNPVNDNCAARRPRLVGE